MAELTITGGRTLPKVCALYGSGDAPVLRAEEVVCGPPWVYWVLLAPLGFVFVLFLLQMTQKRFRVTYFLSSEGWRTMRRRRTILAVLIVVSVGLFPLGALLKQFVWCGLSLLLLPFAFWFQKTYKWPFLVKDYNALTVTLSRLPEELVKAYHDAVAMRPGAPPQPPSYRPPNGKPVQPVA